MNMYIDNFGFLSVCNHAHHLRLFSYKISDKKALQVIRHSHRSVMNGLL